MTIRLSRPDETPLLADMRRAMTLEIDGEDLDIDVRGWRDRFVTFVEDLLAKGEAAFFVAENDGELAGMGCVYKLRNHRSVIYGKPSAYVTSVYVKPGHRRSGIARSITLASIDWARANGCVVIRLRASEMGRLVYRSLGFTQTDEMELRLTS